MASGTGELQPGYRPVRSPLPRQAKWWQLLEASLKSPELLLSFRERLLQNKHSLLVSSAAIRSVIKRDRTARYIYERSKRDIERINGEIKDIESKMTEIIVSSEKLKDNYMPVSSVKGVALINAASILVATQNFTRFDSSWQFACYAGMATFGSQSGAIICGSRLMESRNG